MIVDDYDVMFMTDLVRDHEEIHVFVEHPVDDHILVNEHEDVDEDLQPLVVEVDLIDSYDGDGSDHANYDGDQFYQYDNDDICGSDDIYNNDDSYNNDAHHYHNQHEDNVDYNNEEVDRDDPIEVDAEQVYSIRVGKEPIIEDPSEDKAGTESTESEGVMVGEVA